MEQRALLSVVVASGVETRVNSTTASSQIGGGIAMDAAGDSAIVWQSLNQDGSKFGAYAQRYNAGGNPLRRRIPRQYRHGRQSGGAGHCDGLCG